MHPERKGRLSTPLSREGKWDMGGRDEGACPAMGSTQVPRPQAPHPSLTSLTDLPWEGPPIITRILTVHNTHLIIQFLDLQNFEILCLISPRCFYFIFLQFPERSFLTNKKHVKQAAISPFLFDCTIWNRKSRDPSIRYRAIEKLETAVQN